jgi:4-hydroxybenzoate polyprenyltransferase
MIRLPGSRQADSPTAAGEPVGDAASRLLGVPKVRSRRRSLPRLGLTRLVTAHPLVLSLGAARLHIVLIAFLGTATYAWLFSGRHLWGVAAAAALDWLLLDLCNKLSDLPEDLINNPEEAGWVGAHQRVLQVAVVALFVASLVPTALLAPRLILPRVLFQLGGVAYNFRVLPGRLRLKQIYALKNASAAVLFLITLVGYPWATLGSAFSAPWPQVLALSLFFFFFEMSFEVVYDFKDLAGDRAEGVPTYPAVHGGRGGRLAFDLFLVAAALVLIVARAAGAVGFKELLLLLSPAVQAALFPLFARRGFRARDTVWITHLGSLQLCLYNAWVLLGLPIPP